MKNEKILIFGDSYSTYEGNIPSGFASYYPKRYDGSVDDVSKTWWHMLANETGSEIVMNNSWSGSTICNTRYNGEDCSETSSFIHRLDVLENDGFFEKTCIDRVLVFGGTNDSCTGNACGELMFSDWTKKDLYLILPGISYFMARLQKCIPAKNIHVIINCGLRDDVTNGFIKICNQYGINYTLLENIDKAEGHPTYQGMIQIKEQILKSI